MSARLHGWMATAGIQRIAAHRARAMSKRCITMGWFAAIAIADAVYVRGGDFPVRSSALVLSSIALYAVGVIYFVAIDIPDPHCRCTGLMIAALSGVNILRDFVFARCADECKTRSPSAWTLYSIDALGVLLLMSMAIAHHNRASNLCDMEDQAYENLRCSDFACAREAAFARNNELDSSALKEQ
jgi:hypothetical protein